jgi:hypothetical protein
MPNVIKQSHSLCIMMYYVYFIIWCYSSTFLFINDFALYLTSTFSLLLQLNSFDTVDTDWLNFLFRHTLK